MEDRQNSEFALPTDFAHRKRMVVEIKPEDAQIIAEKLQSGAFTSVEDVIHSALISLPSPERSSDPQKNLAEFLMKSPFAGAGLDLEEQGSIRPSRSTSYPMADLRNRNHALRERHHLRRDTIRH
jgi:Arc/MetJ-type ribon-helix-helix transcriptional regulator